MPDETGEEPQDAAPWADEQTRQHLQVLVESVATLAGFEQYLEATQLSFFNSSTNQTGDVSFFDAFNTGLSGFTLFLPNTSAVEVVNSTLQSFLTNNRTAINAVVFNHVSRYDSALALSLIICTHSSSTPQLCTLPCSQTR